MNAKPRYKVSSVTGYSEHCANNAKAVTFYSVLDTAVCHRVVWTHKNGGGKWKAHRICDGLNAGRTPIIHNRPYGVEWKGWRD